MATVIVRREKRTWYGRPTYSVTVLDPTGRIAFHGYSHRSATMLARALGPLVGDRPVGAVANILAKELTLREPRTGEEWSARL